MTQSSHLRHLGCHQLIAGSCERVRPIRSHADRLLEQAIILLLSFSTIAIAAAETRVGWNFDTGLDPERAREMLTANAPTLPPPGSWVRLRGLETWIGAAGTEKISAVTIARRRTDLASFRERGFRLVAVLRWASDSWRNGVRPSVQQNRLPQDLSEPFERGQQLAAEYGDLIDYWEIDNEPDISFVQENPETYAAFLKAFYWGIEAARGDQRRETKDHGPAKEEPLGNPRPESRNGSAVPNAELRTQNSEHSPQSRSRVLMAPLALPPGPYLEAFVRNHGLSYTDGFNYHFYGYAEDFSGMYRQFEAAVAELLADDRRLRTEGAEQRLKDERPKAATADGVGAQAVLYTNFYPSADGWQGEISAGFGHTVVETRAGLEKLLARPRAAEEPPVKRMGRWLVTEGISVEELADGWRFRVENWPAGPLRAPSVELPLPPGWTPGAEALLSFDYRTIPQEKTVKASDLAPQSAAVRPIGTPFAVRDGEHDERSRPHSAQLQPRGGRTAYRTSAANGRGPRLEENWPERELPLFLTEYGYGGLGKLGRRTTEGRERQAAFFDSVLDQIKVLGIEGALAFLLVPYLERDSLEFGLLMDPTSAPASAASTRQPPQWGEYSVSPALERWLARSGETFTPRRWRVRTPPVSQVVIDFLARKGLGLAKSYSGYFLEGDHGRSIPGEADLALYNFGAEAASGALELDGDAWSLPNGRKAVALTINPGERRLVRVHVRPMAKRFVACRVAARFTPGATVPVEPSAVDTTRLAGAVPPTPLPPTPPRLAPMPPAGAPVHTFEAYFRTENGNLYQTWPRLVPVENWQVYMQRMENFTMAFYGRHALPWRFMENRPVSLVFHFHPEAFPAVFEVRRPQMVRFFAPTESAQK